MYCFLPPSRPRRLATTNSSSLQLHLRCTAYLSAIDLSQARKFPILSVFFPIRQFRTGVFNFQGPFFVPTYEVKDSQNVLGMPLQSEGTYLKKKLTHRLKSGRRATERQSSESTCSLSFSDGLSGNIVTYLVHRTTKIVSEAKHDARGLIREDPGSRS